MTGGSFIIPSDYIAGNNKNEVFTVHNLTEEQHLIAQAIREFMDREVLPNLVEIEKKNFALTRLLLAGLGDLGALGLEVPEEYGGLDLGAVASAITCEELARQASFAVSAMAHAGIGTLPIKLYGTEEQKKKYLPLLVSGKYIGAYCLTEDIAGSDANAVKTTAVLSEDKSHFVLNGQKKFVTNCNFADVYTVFAQASTHDGQKLGLTAFIVERVFKGISCGEEEHKMGIQGSSTAYLYLDNVKVPAENVLGELGGGFKMAVTVLNLGRFKLAAACLGGIREALKDSVSYAKERKQFGKPLSDFGAIRYKLAQMYASAYEVEVIVYRTAGHLEQSVRSVDAKDSKAVLRAIDEFVIECSLAKVLCSEALDFIVDENVQIHGGSGYCESLAERAYHDSRINRIFEGTNEINRMLAVGMLLRKSVKGSLPLIKIAKKLFDEVMSMPVGMASEPDTVAEKMRGYLDNAKKAVILLIGAAMQRFTDELPNKQVLLMKLSDCLINIYILDSVLESYPKDTDDRNEDVMRFIFFSRLLALDGLLRETVPMCVEGDMLRTSLMMLRRFTKFDSENLMELTDSIAEKVLARV